MLLAALAMATLAPGQAQKYSGPKPPKADVPYLLHATKLVETEATEARQQDGKKDSTTYFVAGAASSAKTPLAEPIFIVNSDKLKADTLELYRFDVKNGRRELTMSQKRSRNGPRPLKLSVTKLEGNLYRVEAAETLENGEYSLSPSGSNAVFCFQVF
jgi:hypothetical protein